MNASINTDVSNIAIRNVINSIYAMQKLRIETGNRIYANFRIKLLGEEVGLSDEELDNEIIPSLDDLVTEAERITDWMIENKKRISTYFKNSEGFITSETEHTLVSQYKMLIEGEKNMIKALTKDLKEVPIYTEWLSKQKGCGPLMSGVIISYLDPHKARHCSSFWKYCGLDVVKVEKDGEMVGEGRAMRHAKYNQVEYTAKDGEVKLKNSLGYNSFVKSKLIGVLAGSFIKVGKGGKYNELYYNIKERYANRPDLKDASKGRIDAMAKRYMIKIFLQDLWIEWRELESLEVTEPYSVAKLHMRPHGSDDVVKTWSDNEGQLELLMD